MLFLFVVIATVIAACTISFVATLLEVKRLRRLAGERQGDSICRFARSLDFRRLDTKVVRAVHNELQELFSFVCPGFPVRSTDYLDRDYKLDPLEVEDLISNLAARCNRSLEHCEKNPHYGKVATVSDLVEFLSNQPCRE